MRSLPLEPKIDTPVAVNPSVGPISTTLYRFFFDLISALKNRVPITGSVTFVAATTAAVTLAVPESADTYSVWFAASDDNYHWASSKTVNGFTANAKNSTSATVRYQIIRA